MKKKFSKILGVVATIALLASFLAAPVAADVSSATVSLWNIDDDAYEISENAEYTIIFDANDAIPAVDGEIEIRFPEGTILDETAIVYNADPTIGNVTVETVAVFGLPIAEEGILDADIDVIEEDDDVWVVTIRTVGLGDIPENSSIKVDFKDEAIIENPDTPGDYFLEVRTSEETDWVESEEYEIEVPEVDVLPGVVELYNPSDILMDSETGAGAIQLMLDDADEGWSLKIGEGLYDEDITTVTADVTIEGSGDIEDIIIEGTWTILDADITLDNLTLDGEGVATVINVGAIDFTVQNCVLEDATDELIYDGGSIVDNPTIIEDCIFNIEDEIGVYADAPAAEITDCTFNVEEGEDGTGVVIDAGTDIEVTDCTFNGGSGTGVQVIGGDSEISDCTFDGLEMAFDINDGTADINLNTIQNCEDVAIDIDGAVSVAIHNNTITGNDDAELVDVADIADLAGNVFIMFNTITDNAGDDGLLIDNNDDTGDLECRNNWWGDPDGPGDDAFSDDVESEPFLPGPIGASFIETAVAFGDLVDFEDDVGVTVRSTDGAGAMAIVGAATYSENPVEAIDDAVGFWDVAVIDPDVDIDEITIRLYADVTDDTEVYVWGEARGEWLEADATANLFGGFMSIAVTDITTPTIDDLEGLPFVVVERAGTADAPEITAPEVGAVDISVTPTLAWKVVEDFEDATYEIQIAQDATFAILDEAATSPTNAYIVTTALAEGSSYYWRVRAVTDAGAGDWATGVFTTATPVEPTPPIEIVETGPPEITVTMPAPQVTQAIDPGLLWAIIGVGAVLVISLIVLIVRTRRAV